MKRLFLLVGAAVAAAALAAPGARAQTTSLPASFTVTAEGDGLNVIAAYPGELPVVQSVSASPWGASAALSSLGASSAYAGAPYSPFLYSLPGTVNGLASGALPSLPTPPGQVNSNYPTRPAQTESSGPYTLSAASSPTDSKGSVGIGSVASKGPSAPVFASAETSVDASTGSVTATARAGVDTLDLAGTLDLANVSSTATITETTSGKPVYHGQTDLGTVTASGTTVGLSGSTVKLGGTSVSEPLTTAVLPLLNAALAPSGISLAYIPQTFEYADGTSSTGAAPESSKTLAGVDSGALNVTISRPVPGQGTPSISETLGRVYVTAQNTAIPQSPITGPSGPVTVGGTAPVTQVSSTGSNGSGAVAVAGTGATSSSRSISGSETPSTAPLRDAGGAALVADSGTGTGAARPVRLSATVLSHAAELLYLILVVGALAALTGAQLLRFLGVRLSFGRRRTLT